MAMPFGDSRYHMESDADDEYDQSRMASPMPVVDSDSASSHSESLSTDQTPTIYTSSREMHPAPTQLITQWSRERCAEFISSIGLGQYCSTFLGW